MPYTDAVFMVARNRGPETREICACMGTGCLLERRETGRLVLGTGNLVLETGELGSVSGALLLARLLGTGAGWKHGTGIELGLPHSSAQCFEAKATEG